MPRFLFVEPRSSNSSSSLRRCEHTGLEDHLQPTGAWNQRRAIDKDLVGPLGELLFGHELLVALKVCLLLALGLAPDHGDGAVVNPAAMTGSATHRHRTCTASGRAG